MKRRKPRFDYVIERVSPTPAFDFVYNYEPDQARDENGRWSSTGAAVSDTQAKITTDIARAYDKLDESDQRQIDNYVQWTDDITEAVSDDKNGKRSPAVIGLVNAVSQMPRYDGRAYRGFVMSVEDYDKITAAKKIAIPGITSFSTDPNVAASFTANKSNPRRPKKVVLVVENMTDARHLPNDDEAEVVTRRANFDIHKTDKLGELTYLYAKERT